jgi:hypothetical protein
VIGCIRLIIAMISLLAVAALLTLSFAYSPMGSNPNDMYWIIAALGLVLLIGVGIALGDD